MTTFFQAFFGCFLALIVFTVIAGMLKHYADKTIKKTTNEMQSLIAGRIAKMVDQIEDKDHRGKAHHQLKTAIASNNVAAFQEVSAKVLDYLKKQKEAKTANAPSNSAG